MVRIFALHGLDVEQHTIYGFQMYLIMVSVQSCVISLSGLCSYHTTTMWCALLCLVGEQCMCGLVMT